MDDIKAATITRVIHLLSLSCPHDDNQLKIFRKKYLLVNA